MPDELLQPGLGSVWQRIAGLIWLRASLQAEGTTDKHGKKTVCQQADFQSAAGCHPAPQNYTNTVNAVSVRCTGWYSVSRSIGSRPASRISRRISPRLRPWLVVAPASW